MAVPRVPIACLVQRDGFLHARLRSVSGLPPGHVFDLKNLAVTLIGLNREP